MVAVVDLDRFPQIANRRPQSGDGTRPHQMVQINAIVGDDHHLRPRHPHTRPGLLVPPGLAAAATAVVAVGARAVTAREAMARTIRVALLRQEGWLNVEAHRGTRVGQVEALVAIHAISVKGADSLREELEDGLAR